MNTRTYGSVLKKRISFIIIVMVITTVLAVVATAMLPDQKSVSLSIAVHVSDKQDTPDYKFSRYYGAEASEKFATTVASWFQSPEIVQRVFEDAELDPGTTSLRNLAKIFDAETLSAQNVEVDFVISNQDEARKLLAAIDTMVAERTQDINRDEEAIFVAELAEPIVIAKERSMLINGVVGLIVGLFVGIALAALWEYWREPKSA